MSIDVMSDVWQHSPAKGSALLLLLAIADCANNHGVAHPSVEYLAKKGRMTERNVQLLFKRLVKVKLLRIEPGKGPYGCHLLRLTLSSHYTSNAKGENFSPHEDARKTNEKQNVDEDRDEKFSGGEKFSGAKNCVKNTHKISPLPSLDPSLNPKIPPLPTGETPKGATRTRTVTAKVPMPDTDEGQAALKASIFDQAFAAWHERMFPGTDADAQWDYFVRYCLANGRTYANFRAAFQNSFPWENSPAYRSTHVHDRANPKETSTQRQRDIDAWAKQQEATDHVPE